MEGQEQHAEQTPLYPWHVARGANMVNFSGWSMPLWYPSGAVAEHRGTITAAGMFDTSHMSVVTVEGQGAFELLQLAFTKDLKHCAGPTKSLLHPGKCVYGAFLNERGEVIDDAILYRFRGDKFMVVVNASMGARITDHLKALSKRPQTKIRDLTGKVGKMDLQGPMSAKIIRKVMHNAEGVLKSMTYFSFTGHYDIESGNADTFLEDGTPILLSRSGYTGEFGFEIFVTSEHLVRTWGMVLKAGEAFGLLPCGLAARDSLRAGACLPLSHQDIGPWPFINHPWSFALPFDESRTSFTKHFIGDGILAMREHAPYTYAFAGFDPRKVSTHDNAVVLDSKGDEIGKVLTCVADMAIGWHEGRIYSMVSADRPEGFIPRGLSCGFVRVRSKLAPGEEVELKDSIRKIKALIVEDIRPDRTSRRPMEEMM